MCPLDLSTLVRALAMACICASAATAAAQTTTTPRPTTAPSLADRQDAIRERVQRLENNMVQLAKLLAEGEPGQAERLRDALEKSGEKQLKRRVAALVEKLRRSKFTEADQEQTRLLTDLESLLTLLTNSLSDLDQKRAERERLQKLRADISQLQQREQRQLRETQAAAQAEELRAAAAQLEQLADEQAKLRETKPASGEETRKVAQQQRELTKRAEAARDALQKQRAAARDAQSAEALNEAGKQTGQAADAMRRAQEKLDQSAPQQTVGPPQREAEEDLRRAIQELRKEADRRATEDQLHKLAEAERQSESAAGRIVEELAPKETQSNEGQQSPGQRHVQQAQQQMHDAADRLGEEQPSEAAPRQQKAVDSMESALNELDDALRQLRREEMEETLTALETRFKSMLAKEELIRNDLDALSQRDAKAWTRADQLALAEMAQTQRTQVGECESVLMILTDEGSTVILPDLVTQLSSDLNASAVRLDALDAGTESRALVADIIDVLKEIVGAIEAKQQELQDEQEESQNGDQRGMTDSGEPLLPGSTELKLLRSSQLRINRRMSALLGEVDRLGDAALRERFGELADRQTQLAEMSRRMHERK